MQNQIDALIGEFFAAFDNRAGRKVDLTSLRSLFVPGALIVTHIICIIVGDSSFRRYFHPAASDPPDGWRAGGVS